MSKHVSKSEQKRQDIQKPKEEAKAPVAAAEQEPTQVEKLQTLLRPNYDAALAAQAGGDMNAVSRFHRDYSQWIKDWKDLTNKRFPEEFC